MNRIVLISCVSMKLPHRTKAGRLYVSPLFKLSLTYARKLEPDAIFVLSAKYGLVRLEESIDPYELTLNDMPSHQVKEWADRVLAQLQGVANLNQDHIILLAGERYRRYLVPNIHSYEVPLKGLRIGEQLQRLKELLA